MKRWVTEKCCCYSVKSKKNEANFEQKDGEAVVVYDIMSPSVNGIVNKAYDDVIVKQPSNSDVTIVDDFANQPPEGSPKTPPHDPIEGKSLSDLVFEELDKSQSLNNTRVTSFFDITQACDDVIAKTSQSRSKTAEEEKCEITSTKKSSEQNSNDVIVTKQQEETSNDVIVTKQQEETSNDVIVTKQQEENSNDVIVTKQQEETSNGVIITKQQEQNSNGVIVTKQQEQNSSDVIITKQQELNSSDVIITKQQEESLKMKISDTGAKN